MNYSFERRRFVNRRVFWRKEYGFVRLEKAVRCTILGIRGNILFVRRPDWNGEWMTHAD